MRGKHREIGRMIPAGRIIPAHAGQTSTFNLMDGLESDHPRACGANSTVTS